VKEQEQMIGVIYDKTRGGRKPWKARVKVRGTYLHLGWYASAQEASAAFQGARKAVPPLPPGRPRMPQERRHGIVETYRTVKSQRKTAAIHGVDPRTVRRVLREVRPKLEDYPDMILI
jgi:hypothetical protein